jgi:hypothetical protein
MVPAGLTSGLLRCATMRRAMLLVAVAAGCGGTPPVTETTPEPAASGAVAGVLGPDGMGGAGGVLESGAREWTCDRAGRGMESDTDAAMVAAIEALRGLAGDAAALDARVDWTYWARWERATTLHAPGAPAPGPITDPPHHAAELASILSLVPDDCTPTWIAGKLRIDFPPASEDTPAPNAEEIAEVRARAYAGQEVSAYCGPCAVFAVLFREEEGRRYTVLRAADLRF